MMETKPRVKWVAEDGRFVWRENGPQRAQRRAAARGLSVGAPVRAEIGLGRFEPRQAPMYVGPGGAAPLGRVDRLARYLLQRDVTTHARQGTGWQPTPRQRRRLDKKARRAVPPRYYMNDVVESERLAEFWAQKPDNSIMVAAETVAELDRANDATWELALTDTRGPAASAEPVKDTPVTVAVDLTPASTGADVVVAQETRRGFRVVDRRGEHR